MNRTILMGNLTRDPEVKDIKIGDRSTKVVNFTVAVSRYFKRADGTRDKKTEFIPCEAWDSGAESIQQLLSKGDPVLVEGSIKTESWEIDGQKRSRLKVRVSNFEKLHRKNPVVSSDKPEPETVGASATEDGSNIDF